MKCSGQCFPHPGIFQEARGHVTLSQPSCGYAKSDNSHLNSSLSVKSRGKTARLVYTGLL